MYFICSLKKAAYLKYKRLNGMVPGSLRTWWSSEPSSGKSTALESSQVKDIRQEIQIINVQLVSCLSLFLPRPGFSAQYLQFIFSVLGSLRLYFIAVNFLKLLL